MALCTLVLAVAIDSTSLAVALPTMSTALGVYRGTWFSVLSSMWSVGTVTGPLIGAGFAQNISWRWIFYVNLPIIGLGLVFVVLFLHQVRIPGNIVGKLKRFDWLGSFLFTVGDTAFLFGVSVGGVMYSWTSWRTLLPLILGIMIVAGFALWELWYAAEPIISREIFGNWTLISTYIQAIFHGIILWSLLYFLAVSPTVNRNDPNQSNLLSLPTMLPGILYLLNPGTNVPAWIFLNLPIGVGTGMLFPGMSLSIQAASEPALNGQAAAFFSFLRTFGQSLGVAISGVVFQNAFKVKLEALPAFVSVADEYSRDATIVVGIIKSMPEGEDKALLVQAYADGLKILWMALVAFSGVSMLLSFSIKEYSLEQEHVTKQRLRREGEMPSRSDVESASGADK
ncbi:uncharacterized protein BCR38DRAFT_461338 [Pseudomassariella vexata]|uniref:Major facilitator superfamily domain-containing protein n=1 Tax=Pseudomassariella vexata TaxID=1141098 RepID=A0A1Y2DD27_9PEZI|nr:uncharacterized protein BCR38DRAFT_461338 [Pseudomassariella vexata]ORY57182.1 hypothetical protein BCR38DRAFT_461338 [Pseudomassariella vexata]